MFHVKKGPELFHAGSLRLVSFEHFDFYLARYYKYKTHAGASACLEFLEVTHSSSSATITMMSSCALEVPSCDIHKRNTKYSKLCITSLVLPPPNIPLPSLTHPHRHTHTHKENLNIMMISSELVKPRTHYTCTSITTLSEGQHGKGQCGEGQRHEGQHGEAQRGEGQHGEGQRSEGQQ